MQSEGLLALMRLVSPSLPIGSYAGSDGLEYAVEAGWLETEEDVAAWLRGRLAHSLCRLDVPVLVRAYTAWRDRDPKAVGAWQAFLLASRETRELIAQERAMGFSLARLLADLGVDGAAWMLEQDAQSHVIAFALGAERWGVPIGPAAEGFLFSWCEAQVAAAVKLVPLGQTQGQRILGSLSARIPACAAEGLQIEDDDIGFSEPGLAIASALHEQQHTRLFRS